ncbi:grpE protein homolog, mitochondrial [Eurytemora carolleeae]|uniref:grpE protein homolog, mitochondrial n=1 Tax=Eurytemora carolleeae TaxID=1294199 RepID=UPI000C7940F1|nr:grpE protein homolog, mitochondrial [Eurytemora carolleeae]|eukprot:XP_023336344.1 grpE protein homolog, mitochondrial-like [Eurytemora affinis]
MAGIGRSCVFRALSVDFRIFATPRSYERAIHTFIPQKDGIMIKISPHSIQTTSITAQRRFLFSSKSESPEQEKKEETEEVPEGELRLLEKIAELEDKNADLLDKYRRSLADFENLRNRMNKQVADAKLFGIQSFCKDLLDVADVLALAVDSVPQEALKEQQQLKELHVGLQLTQSELMKVFERHGLVRDNPLGEKFDPNKHNALFQVVDTEKEVNTIVNVQKIGYILQGRPIRPAGVGVSRK